MSYCHTPLQCIWRQWLQPLFYYGCRWDMNRKEKHVDKEMYRVLLDFVADNVDDFEAWLHQSHDWPSREGSDRAVQRWKEYIQKQAFSRPTPGALFYWFLVIAPGVVGGIVALAATTGLIVWFRKLCHSA